ncbi:uncharacterized protein LOC126739536 [Anthonomus grandis grandis]|uniref:uncharacterized protein LOC126739536 n=1 Tax=Anthonomus grandis grandis TaxID=2921223 RepID=UPI0021667275|nr:uncharacterized protein LOC126739536 [Anthonomus grandis grandis]
MSARSKLILQLARKCEEAVISHSHTPDNDHEEMPNTDHPSYKILMPSPTVNSDFSNILDFDDNFLGENYIQLDTASNKVIGDTINKSLAVSLREDQILDIGSVTSSPALSLTADLTAILNSDDSCADKDYLPGQSESESSDDNIDLLRIQRKISRSKANISSTNIQCSMLSF